MNERQLKIEAWGTTDVGMKRRLNEDVFLIDGELGAYVVADGMGGHSAGEVASRLAVDAIIDALREGRPLLEEATWPDHWDGERSATANLLADAIVYGHRAVLDAVGGDTELKGMGTTVVAALLDEAQRRLVIGHVGDSRAYRLRNGSLELLTEDHSWVHEQVREGNLSEEAARTHPLKNVVTQALGGSADPVVDILETDAEPDDIYLLCSDGLNTMLTDGEIERIIAGAASLSEAGQNLVIAANERGGNDNVTVVLLRVTEVEPGA